MNSKTFLSTSEVCSDHLLSQISTCDGDQVIETEKDKKAKTPLPQCSIKSLKKNGFLNSKCVLTEDGDSSLHGEFEMTPKKDMHNPFLRNTDSILSSEIKEECFFNENAEGHFDSMTKSKINKDFIQNLLSQREKGSEKKNLQLSQREIILKNLETLIESKSERQILQLQEEETEKEKEFKQFMEMMKEKQKKRSKRTKRKTMPDFSKIPIGKRREIPIENVGKRVSKSKKNQAKPEKNRNGFEDSTWNLKELALGESKDNLQKSKFKEKGLGNQREIKISFKDSENENHLNCTDSICQGQCTEKIELLKNFFDNLSETHVMKKEDVLLILNEIFQDE